MILICVTWDFLTVQLNQSEVTLILVYPNNRKIIQIQKKCTLFYIHQIVDLINEWDCVN